MKDYTIDLFYARHTGQGSLGMTNKYFYGDYWYKENGKGYEGKSEEICSKLLAASNLTDYVNYEECKINGINGCRSANILQEGENIVTFARIYQRNHGGDLKKKIQTYTTVSDRVEYVLDMLFEATNYDFRSYLSRIIWFDAITMDPDRHFNNLAMKQKADGFYTECPLFDFGASFFSMKHIFPDTLTFEEKVAKLTPQPFAGTFGEMLEVLPNPQIQIDRAAFEDSIKEQPEQIKETVFQTLEYNKELFTDVSVEQVMSAKRHRGR